MMRVFVKLIILVAIVAGILSKALNSDQLEPVFMFRDFFDVALPILGFGALIKFLCNGFGGCSCCKSCGCQKK